MDPSIKTDGFDAKTTIEHLLGIAIRSILSRLTASGVGYKPSFGQKCARGQAPFIWLRLDRRGQGGEKQFFGHGVAYTPPRDPPSAAKAVSYIGAGFWGPPVCDFGVWADLSADLVTLKPKALLEIARQTML